MIVIGVVDACIHGSEVDRLQLLDAPRCPSQPFSAERNRVTQKEIRIGIIGYAFGVWGSLRLTATICLE